LEVEFLFVLLAAETETRMRSCGRAQFANFSCQVVSGNLLFLRYFSL